MEIRRTGFASWHGPWAAWVSLGARPVCVCQPINQPASQPAIRPFSHSAIQPVSGPPERGEARAGGRETRAAYLGRLRLDFTGTSEGSVDFTHDCGLWLWFAVLARCLMVRGGSWVLVVAAGDR